MKTDEVNTTHERVIEVITWLTLLVICIFP